MASFDGQLQTLHSGRILLTGATGYVGGRLLILLQKYPGLPLRCTTRRPASLENLKKDHVEFVTADVSDLDLLRVGLRNVETAFYLVHSMGDGDRLRNEIVKVRRAKNRVLIRPWMGILR